MDQTTVTSGEKTEFKARWRNNQMSFKHENKRNDTELSKYLWQLKEKKVEYTISWKIPQRLGPTQTSQNVAIYVLPRNCS